MSEGVGFASIAFLFERYRGLLGIFTTLAIVYLLSENRRAISKRVIFWGLVLQWGVAIFALRYSWGMKAFEHAAAAIERGLDCARVSAAFVFGESLLNPKGPAGFVFAFRVLPAVIFVSSLFAILYQLGIMQWIVRGFAIIPSKLMRASGAESLNVAASLFLGQTEAPLTIRPYLPKLTRSELLTVMTSGMAHVSGGIMAAYIELGISSKHILTAVIMTAPGSIMLAKMLIPETETPETAGGVRTRSDRVDANLLDAASRGAREGMSLVINIVAMLIAFLALVALINKGLGYFHTSLQAILGVILSPAAYLLGVSWDESAKVGGLLGTRTILNELIAYGDLGKMIVNEGAGKPELSPRSFTIATFALCGFANVGSIGIQLGGIGALVPERRGELARLGTRALLAGTLANYLSACIAGIVV